MPARLSGGQAHRVALGRLLLSHCDALLLDEPYAGLDSSLRRTLTDLVGPLVAQRAVPSILVAHELAEAQAFADRLAVLDRRPDPAEGAPGEVVLRPATRRVAELVGYTAFVPVRSASGGLGRARRHPRRRSALPPGSTRTGSSAAATRTWAWCWPASSASCRPAGALWEIAIMHGRGHRDRPAARGGAGRAGIERHGGRSAALRPGRHGRTGPAGPAAAGGLTRPGRPRAGRRGTRNDQRGQAQVRAAGARVLAAAAGRNGRRVAAGRLGG